MRDNVVFLGIIAGIIGGLIVSARSSAQIPQPKSQHTQQEVTMKVNFYTIDRQKTNKGEFLGAAELKSGKLETTVTDPKLKKILESPYQTMAGEVKNGMAKDWLVTYQPGTKEHLQAIAIECYRFGYIGEIVQQ